MLTGLRLRNFRCFADSGMVPVAPLTVIFGKNNSGKSSLLLGLFLLRQTLEAPEYGPRLNLRGSLYPAGSFADMVHQHRGRNTLCLTFRLESREISGLWEVGLEFVSDEPQAPRLARLVLGPGNSASPRAPWLEIRRGRGAGGPYELALDGDLVGKERRAGFFFPPGRFLPILGDEAPQPSRINKMRANLRFIANRVLHLLTRDLLTMRAVGAFRSQPDRRYEYKGRTPAQVDLFGQSSVNAIIEDTLRRSGRLVLLPEVNKWLKAIGGVQLLRPRRISRSARIFEVRLKDLRSDRWAHLLDVGFGIGQAFPVVVEGLRTPKGGLFVVQEPEIHLHPDAQLAMADFLVELVRRGRRVIVETHSENLLLRFRHAVIGAAKLKNDEVSILYVEGQAGGASSVRPLSLNDLGEVTNWPPGFMEEATDERLAIMEKVAGMKEGGL